MDFDIVPFTRQYVQNFNQIGIDVQDRFIFIPENSITWNLTQDIDFLRKKTSSTGLTCLLAFDTNPTCMFDHLHTREYLLELIDEVGPSVKLLSHNLRHFFEPSSQIYFPYFFLHQLQESNHQLTTKKYLRFSFLSNQPRFHRLWLYQQVKQHITDHDCFVVHADHDQHPDHHFNRSYCRYYLGKDVELMMDLPFIQDTGCDSFALFLAENRTLVDWSNRHAAYSAVYNITGESTPEDDQFFFTEKTWKSIRSGCLTINLGSCRANQYLKRLGFRTDHDLDLPLLDKIQWIRDLMQNTTLQDAMEQQQQYEDLIQHNITRFHSQDLKNMFEQYLRDRLEI